MITKYPIPPCNNEKIIENREYIKFFDEPVNVYNEHYNKLFYFKLEYDFHVNIGKLEIPNCGGHVDSVPSSSMQLDWTASALHGLSVNQTWATNWELINIESYSLLIDKLALRDSKIKSISYSCGLRDLNFVLTHVNIHNLAIRRIWFYNGSSVSYVDADKDMNSELKEFAGKSVASIDQYYMSLAAIIKTSDLLLDSQVHIDLSVDDL